MRFILSSNRGRLALAASSIAVMLGGSAMAQTIRVFDDAPSIEQLRAIMIPESVPGVGRTIVIQRPDMGASSQGVQRASAQVVAEPRLPAVTDPAVEVPPAPIQHAVANVASPLRQAVASVAAPVHQAVSRPGSESKTGTVGMRINFAFNSAILPDSAHTMIDRVAQVMKEAPDIKVRVEGHTDAVGSADYNVELSERRAVSVAEYLVKLGIEPSRLILIGKGMAEPLLDNRFDPANRRVQFVRLG